MSVAETHNVSPFEPLEWSDRQGAEALKEKIEGYWRERGHRVECRLEQRHFSTTMRFSRHDLRSDMVNGYPRFRALPSPEQPE